MAKTTLKSLDFFLGKKEETLIVTLLNFSIYIDTGKNQSITLI